MNKQFKLGVMVVLLLALAGSYGRAGEPAYPGISNVAVDCVIRQLGDKFGKTQAATIEQCVPQVAALWRAQDGGEQEFKDFCLKNYVADPAQREEVFKRFEANLESIDGHFYAVRRQLNWPLDVNTGEILPIDYLFAEISPAAHLDDDFFNTKVAFTALLNFPAYTLEQKIRLGNSWTRDDWAKARLVDRFSVRVPAEIKQEVNSVYLKADDYISAYNIYMHNILDSRGRRMFPEGLKLISHWGLRDELKGYYSDKNGLPKQEMIQLIMERIINQEIPAAVINHPGVDWDPAANKVYRDGQPQDGAAEPDTRYKVLLSTFKVEKKLDPYYPKFPTLIDRKFNLEREVPEPEVEKLFISVLSSPEVKLTGKLIAQRLGRPLQPFDIWYTGFAPGKTYTNAELDVKVLKKYPSVQAVQDDLVNLLLKLGFSAQRAKYISARIQVDPARGAGHAMEAKMRGDKAHLRTRFDGKALNYQGFNTLTHELGHCTEQVISLNLMDHNLLRGVPNTSFTEALAFVFQGKDLELLGLKVKKDLKTEAFMTLNQLWMTNEICGVGLLDMKIWHWLYAHPDATPAELKAAVLELAKGIWNQYYAPVFGVKDSPILAIYSHIIELGMYTPDYGLGHIIQFQLEEYFKKAALAGEMERVCRQGMITPDAWMKGAVGTGISTQPLLKAADAALKTVH